MWAYLTWQGRDFAFERGAPLLIVATLMAGPIILNLRRLNPPDAAVREVIVQLFGTFSLITVLIGVNGIVSNDRVRGYYRLLFAKPVSIPRYYAQAWIVNGLGLLATSVAVCAAIYVIGYPLFVWRVLLTVGLAYIALGGLGFFYSTVWRFDWVLMGGTLALAHVLRLLFPAEASRAGKALHVVLPPFHSLQDTGIDLARGQSVDPGLLLWMLGWGISGFLLGLFVLRRRSLAT
jgi:hypothetical protein